MPVRTLISPRGQFESASLRDLPNDDDDHISVVATLSAYGLHQRKFLDAVFETSFVSSSKDNIISAAQVDGHDSAIVAEPPRHLCILDVAPCDGPDAQQEELRELAWNLSVSIADVILFVIRMRDLARVQSNGLAALGPALTQMLMFRADSVVSVPSSKRGFVVVVRDYESDIVRRDDIIQGFLMEIQNVYAKLAKPPRSSSRISDMFEFEFVLLPNEKLEPEGYSSALDDFKQKLLEPTSDDYYFENSAFAHDTESSIVDCAQQAWSEMEKERNRDVPPNKDLMSTFDCDNAMRKVFEKYQQGIWLWRRETDGGVIVEDFGKAADDMYKKTISVFEADASPHKGSKAFKRKRDELKDLLNVDLYNLFVVQIAKLREVTFRTFRDNLDGINDTTPRLDKEVNAVVKESQRSFQKNASSLRPAFSSWRYDNDEKELVNKLREFATDKLQRARLADYQDGDGRRNRRRRAAIASAAAPKRRQPISLGLHYLNPAPFGFKDSRYEKLNHDDAIGYDTDAPIFGAQGGSGLPLAPADPAWQRANQEYIYSERK